MLKNANQNEGDDQSKKTQDQGGPSNRGFAAMPKEKVQEIASKGGQHSHGGQSSSESKEGSQGKEGQSQDTSARGFASMLEDKVREIASNGGKSKSDQSGE